MDVPAWLASASADAEVRGLPELRPLLETLARSTQALRDADGDFHHPAADHTTADQAAAAHADQSDPSTLLGTGDGQASR